MPLSHRFRPAAATLAALAALMLLAPLQAAAQATKRNPPAKAPAKAPTKQPPRQGAPQPAAQQPTPPPPMPPAPVGRLAGALGDSIHGAPLVGAVVAVEGTPRSGVSDEDGRFVVDSVPPGSHVVTVQHPLLDSLYLSVATPPVHVAADSVTLLNMAIPSLGTMIGSECPPATSRLGPAQFAGRVLEADSKQPAVGVRVLLVWMQLAVGTDIGLRRTPRVRTATTDVQGYYRICGAPGAPEDASVQAERGRVRTAEVPVAIGETGIGLRSLLIGPASDSAARTGRAVAAGRVVDTVNVPVGNAQVSVEGASAVTTTNERGEFTLDGLPSGTQALVVRRIGFAPSRTIVDLAADAPARVAVRLERAVPRLAVVAVTAQSEALSRVGFEDRQRRGMGRFLGPDDLARLQPQTVTSALRNVPGLRVVPSGNGGYTVQSSRDAMGGCVNFWVDGAPFREMSPGELDQTFPASQVAAIETYQATDAPPQFSSVGQGACTVVVIWTQASVQRRR
ncbi:MAG TPA: carboxypeptidase regulatory-like domain-containing protein [Gemmatimonadaceae bacterium]|nr:carboxypeptidase regulatory-like domain-containing protein [Gemmatimonadaceae bacterium]